MDRYAGVLEEAVDGARQQERHYQLLSALQSLVKELPSSFQQRLSYTTLSDLALALLDGTVFEIVQGLLEIQHLTEKSLYNQRLRLQNEHRGQFPPAAQSSTPAAHRIPTHRALWHSPVPENIPSGATRLATASWAWASPRRSTRGTPEPPPASAQAGAATEAPGSPAGLPAPQLARAPGGPAA
ncbi:protein DGCR6 isoform X3 [Diceros bicornis minor]|uniref:protein DGCR6 isoform X3 n=1 Tax=Diceros bicornis minor TaxID=77932 RepID=UPI0026EBE7CF|nr:protein DGCR6 isoform X3 [Diceros bicornis minor]